MNSDDQNPKASPEATVVHLSSYRQKKAIEEEFGRGRSPLYLSHLGKLSGRPPEQSSKLQKGPNTRDNSGSSDFGDRLQRIRSSLEKINRLMSELKKIGSLDEFGAKKPQNSQKPPK